MIFEQSRESRKDFEQLLSKVRNTLGLSSHSRQMTDVSSVVHSRPDVQMQGTFGKADSKMLEQKIEGNRMAVLQERCRIVTRRLENNLGADNDFKQNSKYLSNCSQEFIDKTQHLPISLTRPETQIASLRTQLEKSKDRQLQLRLQCQKLKKQLLRMQSQKELLYRQFQRKCREFMELTDKNIERRPSDTIQLQGQLKQAKFMMEHLKLEAARRQYLQGPFPLPSKIIQMQNKVNQLMSEKFRLEEKLEFQQRLLKEQPNSALFTSDSRLKALRDGVEFWIRKSKKIETEAYTAINILRMECEHLRSSLLQQNSLAQSQLRNQMRKIQSLNCSQIEVKVKSGKKPRMRSISSTGNRPCKFR